MTFLLFATLLYFLPTIVGHNKRNVLAIFLVNFFFGWTFIGWIVAMVWACSAETQPVFVIAGAGPARYCCHCGTLSAGGRFCTTCGRPV
jgi:hypothetical protein